MRIIANMSMVGAACKKLGLRRNHANDGRPPPVLCASCRLSMACPALPLCGLAVTEAERSMHDINARIRASLQKVGGCMVSVWRAPWCW